MAGYHISHYCAGDDSSALALEEQCTQGDSIILKYRRQNFRARSEVYDNYRILCARAKDQVVGITAWTWKKIKLHEQEIRAVYFYDMRVHPEYRKKGVANSLVQSLWKDIGTDNDCIYMSVAADNERCLKPAKKILGFNTAIPFTILIIPIYKNIKEKTDMAFSDVTKVHEMYLKYNPSVDFLPDLDKKHLLGYVDSITLDDANKAGCSIWTNNGLLTEEIVKIPFKYQVERTITNLLRPMIKLPYIPRPKERIRSWFLFDIYADSRENLKKMIAVSKHYAFLNNQHFLYIRLLNNDPLLQAITEDEFRLYKVPYYFLAKGTNVPLINDRIYLDVRDL